MEMGCLKIMRQGMACCSKLWLELASQPLGIGVIFTEKLSFSIDWTASSNFPGKIWLGGVLPSATFWTGYAGRDLLISSMDVPPHHHCYRVIHAFLPFYLASSYSFIHI
jgi:hypothetical protein